MSRVPYADMTARWGARMGDAKLVDMMVGALHDPFHTIPMGVTAENVVDIARRFGHKHIADFLLEDMGATDKANYLAMLRAAEARHICRKLCAPFPKKP